MAGAFAAIAAVGWLLFDSAPYWAPVISALFLLVALTVPGLLLPLNRLWSLLARCLAIVTNFVLLGAFFYLVILPFGLVSRLFGRDSMRRKPETNTDSYWMPVERQASRHTYPDMF